jgi:hypothetical protein
MSWTKRQIIDDAFGELALAGYNFDIDPEEIQAALRKLDLLMAKWAAKGLHVGYVMGATPTDTDEDSDSGLPLIAVSAAVPCLAVQIAASKGKALPPSTIINAQDAYAALVLTVVKGSMVEQQLPQGVPRGAGQKPWRYLNQPFITNPDKSPVQLGSDGGLTLGD